MNTSAAQNAHYITKDPLVSVVITTYNYGQYLQMAINSVLNQTYQNLEIIIVNDGSVDNTDEIIAPYLSNKNIKYIKQKNAGQAVAKNRGFRETTADYIAFLDADDYWMVDKIDKQIRLFSERSIGVVYSALAVINEQGELTNKFHPQEMYAGNILQELWIDNFIGFSTAIIRRECFEKVGLFDENLAMAIDWDLWLRIACHFNFTYVNEPLLFYRYGHANMSRNTDKRLECASIVRERFLQNNKERLKRGTLRKAKVLTYNIRSAYYLPRDFSKGMQYLFKSLIANPFQLEPLKILCKYALIGHAQ